MSLGLFIYKMFLCRGVFLSCKTCRLLDLSVSQSQPGSGGKRAVKMDVNKVLKCVLFHFLSLSQAEEYMRLSQVKCTGLGGSTASSQAVICLELAATTVKFPIDKVCVYEKSDISPSNHTHLQRCTLLSVYSTVLVHSFHFLALVQPPTIHITLHIFLFLPIRRSTNHYHIQDITICTVYKLYFQLRSSKDI